MRVTNRRLPMSAGWWDAPLELRDLAEAICKMRLKNSKSYENVKEISSLKFLSCNF